MERRKFLLLARVLIPGQLLLPSIGLAKPFRYESQIQLIGDIRHFIEKDLDMNIGRNYYTKWKENDGMHIVLYVSLPDQIKKPDSSSKRYLTFGDNMDKALRYQKLAEEKGYHTLIYKTAGVANTRLNKRLLSYRPESISFIAFHEAAHRHIRNEGKTPYLIEEAACDIIGNYGAAAFAKATQKIDKRILAKQHILHEKLHKTLNKTTYKIETGNLEEFPRIYKSCRKKIKKLLKKGGVFVKDRYNYEVNNAFLLRNSYYAENYFLLKKLYLQMNDLKEFVNYITALPPELETAKDMINRK